ncbi:MAG: hypothetical protein M3144_03210, partial [Actinomycetota bacterium]|nr:hypothetical protein [Actinomycetota bacterium]
MSWRAAAVVSVVVVFFAALSLSARWNPVYQSRALVAPGVLTASGASSLEDHLAVARGSALRGAVQDRYGADATVHVGVVDGSALEFRARSHDPARASTVANAYAEEFVDLRKTQLADGALVPGGQASSRAADVPAHLAGPSVVVAARPARSPLPPWPTEAWALAG